MLEWLNLTDCPKCGLQDRSLSDGRITYRLDHEDCRCPSLQAEEHLELECRRCGYIRPMKTKDWKDE